MAGKAKRVVVLPVIATPKLGYDGKPLFNLDKTPMLDERPDWLGQNPDAFSWEITQNYHDVMKVQIRGDADQVHKFADKAKAHIEAKWNPKEDEE